MLAGLGTVLASALAGPAVNATRLAATAKGPVAAYPAPAWTARLTQRRRETMALRDKAVSLRQFGARLDGATDDRAALLAALASGAAAVRIDGPLRLASTVLIDRAVTIFGGGPGPHVIWAGQGDSAAFTVRPASGDPAAFVRDVGLVGLHIVRADGMPPAGHLLRADNVRGLVVSDCTAQRVGLAYVSHLRIARYDRTKGSETVDPAVVAGFSATARDDLNEDIVIAGNRVDYETYMSDVVRFNFARRVVVEDNMGRFAKISWWGGGAKRLEGGMPHFLRRVHEVYIARNTISNVNGGIYGNNGQDVLVVHNSVQNTNDVGIDFEGCLDCLAAGNDCRNAANFVYAAFYAAKNVRFENNRGEQDGSAAEIDRVLGSRPYGTPRGNALFALRGAGFADVPGAIDVTLAGNTFVYAGRTGMGRILPGPFTQLILQNNQLHNVACDVRTQGGQRLVVTGNVMTFDRSATKPITLLGASAAAGEMGRNTIRIDAAQPTGSVAIGYQALPATTGFLIAGNAINGAFRLPVMIAKARPNAPVQADRNSGATVLTGQIALPWVTGTAQSPALLVPEFAE